jgi:hypothetical protein
VVIDGKVFGGDDLLKGICNKIKGTKPAGCTAALEAREATPAGSDRNATATAALRCDV